jgi:hypothetical protein
MDSRRKKVPSLAMLKWVFLEEPPVKHSPKGSFSSKSPQNTSPTRLQNTNPSSFSVTHLPKPHPHRDSVLSRPAGDHIDVEAFQKRIPMVSLQHQVTSLPDLKFPITARVLEQKASRKPGYRLGESPKPAIKAPRGKYKSPWYLPPERWRLDQDKDSKISALQRTRGSK